MMKATLAILSALMGTVLPVAALTSSDLTPTALAGKTLTFTIETGTAPLGTTGSWTGTFGTSPGNSLKIENAGGDTVNIDTSADYDGEFSGLYSYFIDPILSSGDRKTAVLTLWVSGGAGRYELLLRPNIPFQDPEIRQFGGFTIGSGTTKSPEIAVKQPANGNLTDNKSTRTFGNVSVGKAGGTKTFFIHNEGKAALTGLAVKTSGTNKGDFVVGPLSSKSVPGGGTARFKVTFKPRAKGNRIAAIAISSNDADENPFNISLSGRGVK